MKTLKLISLKLGIIYLVLLEVPAFSQSKLIKQIALDQFSAMNAHDIPKICAAYAATASIESPNFPSAKIGPSGIKEVYSRYFAATPDLHFTLKHLFVNDSTAILEYAFAGTFSNPEPGTPEYMKGKKYSSETCTIFEIRNGMIVRSASYFDQVAFLRQTGFFDHNK